MSRASSLDIPLSNCGSCSAGFRTLFIKPIHKCINPSCSLRSVSVFCVFNFSVPLRERAELIKSEPCKSEAAAKQIFGESTPKFDFSGDLEILEEFEKIYGKTN